MTTDLPVSGTRPTQPIADLYRVEGDAVHLIAGARRSDGMLVFPLPLGPEAAGYDQVLLPATGILWSWTVQRFAPKSPYDGPTGDDFRPYRVAYVQLGDALIVEGRIAQNCASPLVIGQPMRVVREIYATDVHGHGCETYAFAPLEQLS